MFPFLAGFLTGIVIVLFAMALCVTAHNADEAAERMFAMKTTVVNSELNPTRTCENCSLLDKGYCGACAVKEEAKRTEEGFCPLKANE